MYEAALAAIAHAGGEILARSQVRATPAWPDPTQPTYWNAAARVRFASGDPAAALALLLAVERQFDRERGARWAARTLDLDLLDFDGRVVAAADLELPHPRLAARRFVLEPLAEIAPDWRHPLLGVSAADHLALLDGAP